MVSGSALTNASQNASNFILSFRVSSWNQSCICSINIFRISWFGMTNWYMPSFAFPRFVRYPAVKSMLQTWSTLLYRSRYVSSCLIFFPMLSPQISCSISLRVFWPAICRNFRIISLPLVFIQKACGSASGSDISRST